MLGPMIGTNTYALSNTSYKPYDKLCARRRIAHRGLGNGEQLRAAAFVESTEHSKM
jgi:hypothetical protein